LSVDPRPELQYLKPAEHGGPDLAELNELGLSPDLILDFSTCINPFGPPPGWRKVLRSLPVEFYPDSDSTQLRRRLASKLGLSGERVLVGAGSVELLRLTTLSFLSPGDLVLIPQPTFGEYEMASRLAGARVLKVRGREEDDFRFDVEQLAHLLRRHRPRMIFLCNPNNPTGQCLKRQEVEVLLEASPESLLVLDEAYISFVRDPWPSLDLLNRGHVLILRSLTKDFSLAGVRLGYALASEKGISVLRRVQPPWSVNVVAQKLGLLALERDDWLEGCRRKLWREQVFLKRGISRLGFQVLPSKAHFFLVRVGRATRFRKLLLQRGILVRDCTSFGLPDHIRLSPRSRSHNRRLLLALSELREAL